LLFLFLKIILLTHFYSRFRFEHGHVVTTSATSIDTFSPCPYNELLWPEDSIPLPVPDWKGFWKIWKHDCPHIRIRNACEDTCLECYVLKHKFRFMGKNNTNGNNNENQPLANDEESTNDASVNSLSLPSNVSSNREEFPYEQLISEATNMLKCHSNGIN
jgi:hypothetical protein